MPEPNAALVWRTLHLPKAGHTADEYEDAYAGDLSTGRFAIADGATESSFSGPWARLLADGYVRQPGPWRNWLPAAQARWGTEHWNPEQPWYVEAKVEEGAYATLLGVRFGLWDERGPRAWQARAVGDSCLFHLRGDKLRCAFPLERSADFTNQPHLIGSHTSRDDSWKFGHRRTHGRWQPRDRLVLMTDALAQWFLLAVEAGRKPWRKLDALKDADAFTAFIAKLRLRRKIRNDDVTLITIAGAGESPP